MCVIADHQGLSLCERGVLIADTRCMRRHQAVVGTYVSTRQERDTLLCGHRYPEGQCLGYPSGLL